MSLGVLTASLLLDPSGNFQEEGRVQVRTYAVRFTCASRELFRNLALALDPVAGV
jgi:hypothetical protein